MSMIETARTEALSRFLDVDVARYKLMATNMANIDTPGYHARDLDFRAELRRAGGNTSGSDGGRLSYASYGGVGRALHGLPVHALPVRGLMERPDGNNVSVERESLLLAEAQLKFSLGVQLLKAEFHGISQAINSGGPSS